MKNFLNEKKKSIQMYLLIILGPGIIAGVIGYNLADIHFRIETMNMIQAGLVPDTIQVGGVTATYEYVPGDKPNMKDFYKLDDRVTYAQVVEKVGKQNGFRGSGMILPYWHVDEDLFVVISFSYNDDGEMDKVGSVFLCNSEETLEVIYPR